MPDLTTEYEEIVPVAEMVATGQATGNPWLTLLATLLTIAASIFTGNGDLDDSTVEALDSWSPGLGGLLDSAVNASNGAAPAFTEWAGDASLLGELGFLTPFDTSDGIVGGVTTFLRSNPLLLIGGVVLVWWLWNRSGSPDVRFWRRAPDTIDSMTGDIYT